MNQDLNVVALAKGNERYVWMYADDQVSDVLRSIGRFAASPVLSLSWNDAANLSGRIRDLEVRRANGSFILREKGLLDG